MGFNSAVHRDQLKDVVKTFQTGCLKRLAMIAVLKCEKLSLKLLSFLVFVSCVYTPASVSKVALGIQISNTLAKLILINIEIASSLEVNDMK